MFSILANKTHVFCSSSLFLLSKFLALSLQFTANTYFRRLSLQRGARLCANHIIYYGSVTLFSRRPLWGGLKCDRGVKLIFFIFVFSFVAAFSMLVFTLANVLDSFQITAFGSRRANLLPSLGCLRGARRELFCIVKTMLFAYFHKKYM